MDMDIYMCIFTCLYIYVYTNTCLHIQYMCIYSMYACKATWIYVHRNMYILLQNKTRIPHVFIFTAYIYC